MENNEKLNQEKEIKDVNDQFVEFLHTKGLNAKFKLAFANMKESAKAQHEIDKANFNAVKEKSKEENKDFVEFLHTKGLKAKIKLVINNIKKGAKESRANTKAQIEKARQLGNPYRQLTPVELDKEFNEFLKSKGLDSKYMVEVKVVEK